MEQHFSAGFCLSNTQQEFSLFCPAGSTMSVVRMVLGAHTYSTDKNCYHLAGDCVEDIDAQQFEIIKQRCSVNRYCTYNYGDNMKSYITCDQKGAKPDYFQISYSCMDDKLVTLYACVGVLAFLLLALVMILILLRVRHKSFEALCKLHTGRSWSKPKTRDPMDDHTYVNEGVVNSDQSEPKQRWSSVAEYDDIVQKETSHSYINEGLVRSSDGNRTNSSKPISMQSRSLPQIPDYEKLNKTVDSHGYVVPVHQPESIILIENKATKPAISSITPESQAVKTSQTDVGKKKQEDTRKNPGKEPKKPKEYDSDSIKSIKGKIKVKSVVLNINETNTMEEK